MAIKRKVKTIHVQKKIKSTFMAIREKQKFLWL